MPGLGLEPDLAPAPFLPRMSHTRESLTIPSRRLRVPAFLLDHANGSRKQEYRERVRTPTPTQIFSRHKERMRFPLHVFTHPENKEQEDDADVHGKTSAAVFKQFITETLPRFTLTFHLLSL